MFYFSPIVVVEGFQILLFQKEEVALKDFSVRLKVHTIAFVLFALTQHIYYNISYTHNAACW